MERKTEITNNRDYIITLLKKKVCPRCGHGVKAIMGCHPVGEYDGVANHYDPSKIKWYRVFICCNEKCPIDEWKIPEKLANGIEQQMVHGKI